MALVFLDELPEVPGTDPQDPSKKKPINQTVVVGLIAGGLASLFIGRLVFSMASPGRRIRFAQYFNRRR